MFMGGSQNRDPFLAGVKGQPKGNHLRRGGQGLKALRQGEHVYATNSSANKRFAFVLMYMRRASGKTGVRQNVSGNGDNSQSAHAPQLR